MARPGDDSELSTVTARPLWSMSGLFSMLTTLTDAETANVLQVGD